MKNIDRTKMFQHEAAPFVLTIIVLGNDGSLALSESFPGEDTFYLNFPQRIRISNARKLGDGHYLVDESNADLIENDPVVLDAIKDTKQRAAIHYKEERINDLIRFVNPEGSFFDRRVIVYYYFKGVRPKPVKLERLPYPAPSQSLSRFFSTKYAKNAFASSFPNNPKTGQLLIEGKILNLKDFFLALYHERN